jgi:nitroreductase
MFRRLIMFRVPKSVFQQKRSKRYVIPGLSFQWELTVNFVCLSTEPSSPLADEYLAAAHIHEAPVWIVPCLEGATPTRTSGSSIYPAVQNMLLAARALGLGATLTTLYLQFEKEAEAALGLPEGVHSYALIPIGYPMGRFGPVRRVPLADVVYEDRWGEAYRDL